MSASYRTDLSSFFNLFIFMCFVVSQLNLGLKAAQNCMEVACTLLWQHSWFSKTLVLRAILFFLIDFAFEKACIEYAGIED